MVFPHEHVLLRFNGHFGSTATTFNDRWSCGIRMGLPASAPAYDAEKLQTLCNAAMTAAKTFHTASMVTTGTTAFLDYVSGAQIGVSGKYTPPSQLTIVSPTDSTAGVGTPVLPWNSAAVMSLRTDLPRGRASNGRVYWPIIAGSIDSFTGRLAGTPSTARVNAFATFLGALNTAGNTYSPGMKVVVASNVGGGLIATVTAVRMDDRVDSIERRENDQPPVYRTAVVP